MMSVKKILAAFFLLYLTVFATSCGVKNDPKGLGKSDYPRSYPANR
tara:strand:+ start:4118 stop:4255 length:138 start_codon:yes stop_codon:yes gene_type:complete